MNLSVEVCKRSTLDLSYDFWHPFLYLMHNFWICSHQSPIKYWGKGTKYIQKHIFASLKVPWEKAENVLQSPYILQDVLNFVCWAIKSLSP